MSLILKETETSQIGLLVLTRSVLLICLSPWYLCVKRVSCKWRGFQNQVAYCDWVPFILFRSCHLPTPTGPCVSGQGGDSLAHRNKDFLDQASFVSWSLSLVLPSCTSISGVGGVEFQEPRDKDCLYATVCHDKIPFSSLIDHFQCF